MKNLSRFPAGKRSKGFSLLEVLVAVVIVSVGLLALASLQLAMIRSSSETKAQTVALTLAKDQIEAMKAFQDVNIYRGLTSQAYPLASNVSEGGVAFKRWWEVRRYVFNGATFVETNLVTGTDAQLALANPALVPGNEFKQITMHMSWFDANAVEQFVNIEDSIAAINPGDSLLLDNAQAIKPRGPRVLISNPEAQAGVIPVAMGNGSDTAATNPKPEVGSNNTGTSFDVLTYKSNNDVSAPVLAQERVETTLVKCRCEIPSVALATGVAYRPTFWNGFRYTSPVEASYYPKGRELATAASSQTDKCIACCRDHHDPSTGFTGAKFDPRRTTHAHYKYNVSDVLTLVTTGEYLEACRIIRVDGFNRVATDMFADHFAILPTATDLQGDIAGSPVPSQAAKDGYEIFVKAYLAARVVDVDDDDIDDPTQSSYNTPVSDSDMTDLEDASGTDLNEPAMVNITKESPDNPRWVHTRGLYMDYLESEALDVIKDKKDKCGGTLADCVLPVLPFTSINTTELTDWTTVNTIPNAPTTLSPDNRVISVENNSVQSPFTGDGTSPVRGKVLARSVTSGNRANAHGQFGASNAALALQKPIDVDDVPDLTAPTQFYRVDDKLFEINASVVQPPTSFQVNLLSNDPSFPVGSFPAIDYTISLESGQCSGSSNPVLCDPTATLGVAGSVTVSRYNDATPRNKSLTNPCQTNKVSPLPYKLEFDVTAATVDGYNATNGTGSVTAQDTFYSAVAPIAAGESTQLQFYSAPSIINDSSVVNITFGNLTYFCPTGFSVNNGTGIPDGGYTCGGPGNNDVIYATTFTECYNGFTP